MPFVPSRWIWRSSESKGPSGAKRDLLTSGREPFLNLRDVAGDLEVLEDLERFAA